MTVSNITTENTQMTKSKVEDIIKIDDLEVSEDVKNKIYKLSVGRIAVDVLIKQHSLLRQLKESGLDPNERSDNNYTPLMFAALMNDKIAAEILKENGADISLLNNNKESAFDIAYNHGSKKFLEVFEKEHNDTNFCRNNIAECYVGSLGNAALKEDLSKVNQLLKEGYPIDQRSLDGTTPLMWSIIKKREQVANDLIYKGANLLATNSQGKDATDIACDESFNNFLLYNFNLDGTDLENFEKNVHQNNSIKNFCDNKESRSDKIETLKGQVLAYRKQLSGTDTTALPTDFEKNKITHISVIDENITYYSSTSGDYEVTTYPMIDRIDSNNTPSFIHDHGLLIGGILGASIVAYTGYKGVEWICSSFKAAKAYNKAMHQTELSPLNHPC
jgi:ankyrin repeat protein